MAPLGPDTEKVLSNCHDGTATSELPLSTFGTMLCRCWPSTAGREFWVASAVRRIQTAELCSVPLRNRQAFKAVTGLITLNPSFFFFFFPFFDRRAR